MSIFDESNQKDPGTGEPSGDTNDTKDTAETAAPGGDGKSEADGKKGGLSGAKESLALVKGGLARKMALRREAKRQAMEALKNAPQPAVTLRDWYTAFLCMNVPFFGWIYLLTLTRNQKHPEIQPFAKAYLLFKLTFLLISMVVLIGIILIGLNMMDQLLAYMDML